MREYQLFTGSKEIYGQSYRYVDAHNITASATPKGLLCLERMEGGKALVRPLELKLSSGQTILAASPEFMAAFRRALDRETELRDRIKAIDTRDIGSVNTRLADAKLDIKAIERSYDIREENGRRTAVPRKTPFSRIWTTRPGTGPAPRQSGTAQRRIRPVHRGSSQTEGATGTRLSCVCPGRRGKERNPHG